MLPSTMVGSISFHGSDCNGAVDQLEHNLWIEKKKKGRKEMHGYQLPIGPSLGE